MGHAWMVPKGGFEPPPSYRGLGPEPSASANSATLVQTWNAIILSLYLDVNSCPVISSRILFIVFRAHYGSRTYYLQSICHKNLVPGSKMDKTAFPKIRFGDAEIPRILPSLADFSHGFIQISDSKGTAAVALSSRLSSIRKSIRPNTFFTVFGR